MALLELFFSSLLGAGIIAERRNQQEILDREKEREKRRNTPCYFSDGISEKQFEIIAKTAGKNIKRLTDLSVFGPVVSGTVRAQSGISEWDFKIDFNDYGHITGAYWIESENYDSNIPKRIADIMNSKIVSVLESGEKSATEIRYENKKREYENIYSDVQSDINENSTTLYQQGLHEKRKNKIKRIISGFFCVLFVFLLCAIFSGYYKYQQYKKNIEVGISSEYATGKNYELIERKLEKTGFTNINTLPLSDLEYENVEDEYTVSSIVIKGEETFDEKSEFPYDSRVEIRYHTLKEIMIAISEKSAKKMSCEQLTKFLEGEGFVNISKVEKKDLLTGWIKKDGSVASITVDGKAEFSEDSTYRPDVQIVIEYHTFDK